MSGVKGNHYTLGLKGKSKKDNCTQSLDKDNHVPSILHWSQQHGKETGTANSMQCIEYTSI